MPLYAVECQDTSNPDKNANIHERCSPAKDATGLLGSLKVEMDTE